MTVIPGIHLLKIICLDLCPSEVADICSHLDTYSNAVHMVSERVKYRPDRLQLSTLS
jgi:hypothetical protein